MRSGFKETVFTPVLLIAVFLLVAAVNFIPEDALGMNDNPYLAVLVIELATYGVPSLFYCRIRGREFTPRLRLRLFDPSQLLYLLYAAVFLISGGVLIGIFMYSLVPESFASASLTEYAAFAMNQRFFDGLYLVIVFAVFPAITEEFLFRSIVVGEYETKGAVIACVMSAAAFGMFHFSLARFPVYFFSGIVLVCILYTTRSVLASMLVHALNNAAVLLSEKYVLHIADKQNVSLLLLTIILGIAALASGTLMCFEAHSIYKEYAEKNEPSEYANIEKKSRFSRIAETFFTPTFLLLVILFIVAAMAEMT